METKNIRRINLKMLLDASQLKQADFAERCGLAPSVISQLVNGHRNLGDTLARKIEESFAVQRGWLDVPHAPAQSTSGSENENSENPPSTFIQTELNADEKRLLALFNRLPQSEKSNMINAFEARAEELERLFSEFIELKTTKSPLK